MTTLYVVEALRSGDREKHSYVVGVFSNLMLATSKAMEHADYRGGKYVCVVNQFKLDECGDSDWSATLMYQTS